MSDFILKFWPIEASEEDKTEALKQQMLQDNILVEESVHWGKAAYKVGEELGTMIDIQNEAYLAELKLQIEEEGYGVEQGAEDFEYINRKNVICIHNGDGEIKNWSKFEAYLSQATKQKYKGGWELL
jgi:hypothetical protein